MTHEQIVSGLLACGKSNGWVLTGDDYANIVWLREDAKPTEAEMQAALGI